jgi:hypothetical protein
MALLGHHCDGNSWLGVGAKGSLRDSAAAYNCGYRYNGGSNYTTTVFYCSSTKPWKPPGQPTFGFGGARRSEAALLVSTQAAPPPRSCQVRSGASAARGAVSRALLH